MTLEFRVSLNIMRLYNGKRSFYLALVLGSRRYWVQRWDLVRDSKARIIERDRLMSWSWGVGR